MARMIVSRCCCQCRYVPSDGNEYTDDFSVLDPGWLVPGAQNLSVSGGRLRLDNWPADPASNHYYAYRTASVVQANLLLVIEAQCYSNGAASGVLILEPTAYPPGTPIFAFFQRQNPATDHQLWAFNSSVIVPQTAVPGDKLTIKLHHRPKAGQPQRIQACYFINELLVYERTANWPIVGTIRYGVVSSKTIPVGEWDNFTFHNGNP